jgi:hypothetical protein
MDQIRWRIENRTLLIFTQFGWIVGWNVRTRFWKYGRVTLSVFTSLIPRIYFIRISRFRDGGLVFDGVTVNEWTNIYPVTNTSFTGNVSFFCIRCVSLFLSLPYFFLRLPPADVFYRGKALVPVSRLNKNTGMQFTFFRLPVSLSDKQSIWKHRSRALHNNEGPRLQSVRNSYEIPR